MQVTFWGTRGSIAKPGPGTVRYGGNTSCVEVRSSAGTLVVLDCGTGAHGLGQALLAGGGPIRGHLLIGHTHWDHIQGFPFFAPLFVPGNEWDVYAPRGLVQQLRDTLADQMQYTFFPVDLHELRATIRYHELLEGSFQLGDVRVVTRYLNHPALTLGYRLEADGASVVYATDHEPHGHASATPATPFAGDPHHFPHREDRRHAAFLADADLLVHDAQYTAAEYPNRMGWGHSTVEYVVDLALAARVRRLALFRHDPGRTDAAVDALVGAAARRVAEAGGTLDVSGAAEGDRIVLAAADPHVGRVTRAPDDALAAGPVVAGRAVVLAACDAAADAVLTEVVRAEGLVAARSSTLPEGLRRAGETDVAMLFADHDALGDLEAVRRWRRDAGTTLPLVVVAGRLPASDDDDVVTDWLIRPFSAHYVRTKLRAWLLRGRGRWTAAPRPPDEAERLEAVRRLGAADPRSLSRILRLAERVFDAPCVGIGLVEEHRQLMITSSEVQERPRDVSVCAHVILQSEPLVIYDDDPRFGDNTIFTEQHYRSYLGSPLRDAEGRSVGALCVMDRRPQRYQERDLQVLKDLADMASLELARVGAEGMPEGAGAP